ncbi:MAG: hypothetical protein JWO32_2845 [Bacteroidetes bacterium]|nr:hypothetical protein [Bacteroidota bacterium]
MRKDSFVACIFMVLFLFSTSFKSQNTDILKAFINKNDFVLRSVQKHSILLSNSSNDVVIKSILKLQLISIKFYQSDNELSKQAAYQARMEGLSFLQKNTGVPLEYFKLTEKEKIFFGTPSALQAPQHYLPESELKSIEEAELNNPASLNSFVVTIQ